MDSHRWPLPLIETYEVCDPFTLVLRHYWKCLTQKILLSGIYQGFWHKSGVLKTVGYLIHLLLQIKYNKIEVFTLN